MEERRPKCLRDLIKGIRIPKFEEIRRKVLSIYNEPVPLQKGVKRRALVKYLIRIRKIRDYLNITVFSQLDNLPKVEDMHEFYLELMRIGGVEDYKDVLSKLRSKKYVIEKLTREYLEHVRMSFDAAEAKKLTREYIGRVLSVFRRCRKQLDSLSYALNELKRMPCIDMQLPKIVVAGMPQVGKSTFVKAVSTADPEVSPFPFTTKEIIVGHRLVNYEYIQIIDTPGILDRPFSQLNNIERKALSALKHLADVVIFLIDPYEGSYYSLDSQINLLKSVTEYLINPEKAIVAINKIDLVKKERMKYVESKISEVFNGDVVVMSALRKVNVDEVINKALRKLQLGGTYNGVRSKRENY